MEALFNKKKGVSLVAAGQRGVAFACRDNAVTTAVSRLLLRAG